MVPNKLITFDLDALRRAFAPNPLRVFRAVEGVTLLPESLRGHPEPLARGHADIWVFVDGQLQYSRLGINAESGPRTIEIKLPEQAKFLTLAATDRTGARHYDWVLFGNPRIELGSIGADVERTKLTGNH